MPSKAVADAVEARLAADWSGATIRGINDSPDAPKDRSAFVVVQYPVANGEMMTVGAPGSNIYRESGVVRFVINAKREAGGIGTALTWADEIAALFRGKDFNGVLTFAPSPPVIDDGNDTGAYFAVAVAVEYQHDITG